MPMTQEANTLVSYQRFRRKMENGLPLLPCTSQQQRLKQKVFHLDFVMCTTLCISWYEPSSHYDHIISA